jgi:hypothetical protein
MPGAFPVAIPLLLAAVLIASAIGKFRRPDDLTGWAELGVPRALRREWIRALHPWGELALGLAVALLGGWLGVLASLLALTLMIVYTLLVVRVMTSDSAASCACFGSRRRVSRVTVVRNVWLTLLAAAAAAVVWVTPILGGALAAGIPQWTWLIALAVAGITTALILWPEKTSDGGKATDAATGVLTAASDYVRARTPAVPVTLADGTVENLRAMAARKPILLLAVSSLCEPCERVIAQRGEFRALLPEVDVRLLFAEPVGMSPSTEYDEPMSLHDVEEYIAGSLGYVGTPSAVLLGADGLLAGGPVTGDLAVERFVDDNYESLHGERPAGEASAG